MHPRASGVDIDEFDALNLPAIQARAHVLSLTSVAEESRANARRTAPRPRGRKRYASLPPISASTGTNASSSFAGFGSLRPLTAEELKKECIVIRVSDLGALL